MKPLFPLILVAGCAAQQLSLNDALQSEFGLSTDSEPAPRLVAYLDWQHRTLHLFDPPNAERAVRQGIFTFRRVAGSDRAIVRDDRGKSYSFRLVEQADDSVMGLKRMYGSERIVMGRRAAWEPGFNVPCSQPSIHQRATLMTPQWAHGLEMTQYDVKRVVGSGDLLFKEKYDVTRIGYWYDTPDCRKASQTSNFTGRARWLLQTRPPR